MKQEELKDAGEVLQNILTQPLDVLGAKEDISLIEAAKSFDPANPMASDLRKILVNFLQFPEPTATMLRELELIHDDLSG